MSFASCRNRFSWQLHCLHKQKQKQIDKENCLIYIKHRKQIKTARTGSGRKQIPDRLLFEWMLGRDFNHVNLFFFPR